MAVQPGVAGPQASASTPARAPDTSFEQRWDAWQAKGVASDRAFRRQLTIAVPVIVVVVALIAYVLLTR